MATPSVQQQPPFGDEDLPLDSYETDERRPLRNTAVHLAHCYQGEYEHSCKYGDDDCPAAHGVDLPDGGQNHG